MDELIVWLRAQLDEDGRVAREATVGPWSWGPSLGKISWALEGPDVPFGGRVLGVSDAGCPSRYDATHIARWDPARVLSEVEAKRRILDEHRQVEADDVPDLVQCGFDKEVMPCDHVRLLAQPYAGRPGWRQEWARVR